MSQAEDRLVHLSKEVYELRTYMRRVVEIQQEEHEHLRKQIQDLHRLVHAQEENQLLKQLNTQADKQEELQASLQTQAQKLEETGDLLNSSIQNHNRLLARVEAEASIPVGVVPDSARLAPDIVPQGGQITKAFNVVVRELMKFALLTIWFFIGLYLWIPLLFRTVITFSSHMTMSQFTGSDISSSQSGLYMAIGFFTAGFQKIKQSFSTPNLQTEPIEGLTFQSALGVLGHIAFSTVFYLFVLSPWLWF